MYTIDPVRPDNAGPRVETARVSAPLLDDAGRRQLDRWNESQQDYPRDTGVPALITARAAYPHAPALVMGARALTYGELDHRSTRLAQRLRALGVGTDVPVGLCLRRCPAMVVGALAVLKAGGAYVPLDPSHPDERLAFMLDDARAPVLLTERAMRERLPASSRRVIVLDDPDPSDTDALEPDASLPDSLHASSPDDLHASLPDGLHASSPDGLHASLPDDLAYVIYTSGSSGQPKGVGVTHRALLNLVFWHRQAFAVTSDDRATQLAGPGFDAAVWELWPYLTAGACVYLPDEETRGVPERLRDWLVAQGITITFLPTALAESALTLSWPRDTSLRLLLTGADALHSYPPADLPFAVVNNYGPTECTVVATSGRVPVRATNQDQQDVMSAAPIVPSLGRPIANTQLYILDDELRRVPIGAVGELCIGGDGLARGYLGRPELTARQFIPHPFSAEPGARLYRSGDLALFRPNGEVEFRGRRDGQVKIRGFRVEPDEVMSAINAHPAVQTSAVVAREDTPGERRLVAYVVPVPMADLTPAELRTAVAARLPDYMVPAAWVRLESLPLTPNGKIDRDALLAPASAPAWPTTQEEQEAGTTAARTPVEERVAALMAGLLKHDHIGLDDNFFLLGGHSLLGTQLIVRVREAFGVDLTLRSLFQAPTVAGLAAAIESLILARIEALTDEEALLLLASEPGDGANVAWAAV